MTVYEEVSSPTVVTDTAAEYDLDINHEYVHLDDLDELSEEAIEGNRITAYIFEHEGRRSELQEAVENFRGNYILAVGIEWPTWLTEEIDEMDTELLVTLEWLLVINQGLEDTDLEYVRRVHGAIETNGGEIE